MTLILKQLFNLLKLLNSDTGTTSICFGVVCGLILGFTPAFSPQTIFVIVVLLFFRVQAGAAFVSAFFFKIPAHLFDFIFHEVGKSILEIESLVGVYTTLYNMPIVPFTKFNNTVVMGSFMVALILSPFIFFLSKFLINKYRKTVVERFKKTKFFKALKATSLFKWYAKYDQLYS